MSQLDSDFQYSIRRSAVYGVIIFTGMLSTSAIVDLELCRLEIGSATDFKGVVIDFSGVTTIAAETIPALALLQQKIRQNKAELRLSGLASELIERLDKKGVLRKAELARDVREALAMLVAIVPDKALKI